jgi:hypothetical protein
MYLRKVLLSKISTKVKSTIECKRKVLKTNRTFNTNTLMWVYTNTPTWELIGTVTWVHTDTLTWELIGKDNGLTWVYTNTRTWELIGKDDGYRRR